MVLAGSVSAPRGPLCEVTWEGASSLKWPGYRPLSRDQLGCCAATRPSPPPPPDLARPRNLTSSPRAGLWAGTDHKPASCYLQVSRNSAYTGWLGLWLGFSAPSFSDPQSIDLLLDVGACKMREQHPSGRPSATVFRKGLSPRMQPRTTAGNFVLQVVALGRVGGRLKRHVATMATAVHSGPDG